MEAGDVIEALGLMPHPEGGHYRETWADRSSTAIYFLLRHEDESAWVRDRITLAPTHPMAEIAYWVRLERLRRGIATRALNTLASAAFAQRSDLVALE